MENWALSAALEREHREIDEGIEAFAAALVKGEEGVAPLTRAMEALRRHIYLEEEFLFPPLRDAGLMAPVLVMLREHGEIWRAMDRLDAAVARGPADGGAREMCDELLELLRAERFVQPGHELAAEDVMAYLAPFVDPVRTTTFHFTRRWLQRQAERVGDLRSPDFRTGRWLNLPPDYLLIHRVTLGAIGILCQLDAEVDVLEIIERWQPGFTD